MPVATPLSGGITLCFTFCRMNAKEVFTHLIPDTVTCPGQGSTKNSAPSIASARSIY